MPKAFSQILSEFHQISHIFTPIAPKPISHFLLHRRLSSKIFPTLDSHPQTKLASLLRPSISLAALPPSQKSTHVYLLVSNLTNISIYPHKPFLMLGSASFSAQQSPNHCIFISIHQMEDLSRMSEKPCLSFVSYGYFFLQASLRISYVAETHHEL